MFIAGERRYSTDGRVMSELRKKLGKRIKQIREQRSIKQCVLAEKLNMEPSNLTRIESGYQFPKEENLVKIAKALDIEIKDLFSFPAEISKEEILEKINKEIDEFSCAELIFIYNFLLSYKVNKDADFI